MTTAKNKIITLFASSLVVLNLSCAFLGTPAFSNETKAYKTVSALELVNKPQAYLNAPIKIEARFDKFSTLGLDYKPAFRDSKKYISFLIRRPDIQDHVIPLSELKFLILRDKAEKLIELESGDRIEITGSEFSTALNDPWIEVDEVRVLSSKTLKPTSTKLSKTKNSAPKKKK